MSESLAKKVHAALHALFAARPSQDEQPADVTLGGMTFLDRVNARPEGDDRPLLKADEIQVEPVSAELGETGVAVAFSLSEDPRDDFIRRAELQVTVAAHEYDQVVIAGEFLAALPAELRALIGLDENGQVPAGLPFTAVDEGETGQERDEEDIYSMGRSFTLFLESE